MERELIVNSISDYVENVSELNSKITKNLFLESAELLFRGQSDKENHVLLPAIARNRKYDVQCTIFNEERNLIEMAKYKMPDVFRSELTPIELLALLQHHGIPTRLLDVTENALVALYFACCSNTDRDGEVIVFKHINYDITNYPIINAIADSYRFTSGTWTPLSSFYGDVKEQPYFLEQRRMQDIVHKNDKQGGRWIEECCGKIMYIHAPFKSIRQQVQQGRYILFPNSISRGFDEEGCFGWKMDAIPKDHPDIALRIIVPKEIKKKCIEDLSVLGIKKEFLFCDNVDIVCEGILDTFNKRYIH